MEGSESRPTARTRHDSVIVIIRQGKTQHNTTNLGCLPDGRMFLSQMKESKRPKKLGDSLRFMDLKLMLYIRAGSLETALYGLDEMDSLWVPTVKPWRLNERRYGELIGLSKQMVKQMLEY
jgi:bisphosphoglycerate-dependent phosphoglycerate mutase